MPPFRVILIELDRSATSVVMASFDRAPDIGSTIELPTATAPLFDTSSATRPTSSVSWSPYLSEISR